MLGIRSHEASFLGSRGALTLCVSSSPSARETRAAMWQQRITLRDFQGAHPSEVKVLTYSLSALSRPELKLDSISEPRNSRTKSENLHRPLINIVEKGTHRFFSDISARRIFCLLGCLAVLWL